MNDTNENDKNSNEAAVRTKSSKKAKLILVLVLLAAAMGIYMYQGRSLSIKGWSSDIDGAMTQAKDQQRPVVAFFVNRTPSQLAKDIKKAVIPKPGNRKALEEGKFIKVIVAVDSLQSDIAKKYNITKLPTLIAFDPSGKEYNRLEGANAKNEVGFRTKLLNRNK